MNHHHHSRPLVAGLGEVLWDIFPDASRLGGAPANFACHAAALGAKSFLISSVGHDQLGDQAVLDLDQLNVCTDHVVRNKHPTGTVSVEIIDDEPHYKIASNSAWDYCTSSASLRALAKSLDAVCYGTLFQRSTLSWNTTKQFLASTQPECLRVFDVNLRQDFYSDDTIARLLDMANVLKLNDHELPIVAKAIGISAETNQLPKLILGQFDLKMVALTSGSEGSLLITQTEEDFCPATPIDVVSTVGAGDAFTAGIVMGLLSNAPISEINKMASQLAAKVCRQQGAIPS